jgi:hypothetical protein
MDYGILKARQKVLSIVQLALPKYPKVTKGCLRGVWRFSATPFHKNSPSPFQGEGDKGDGVIKY